MRIDSGVNYSSFMQHFNPLDVRPAQDPSSQQSADTGSVVSGVGKASAVRPATSVSEGSVSGISSEGKAVSARNPYKNTAVQDIEIDFGKGLEISTAATDKGKDSMLQDYQYFVGNRKETLVDNNDGMVLRLG